MKPSLYPLLVLGLTHLTIAQAPIPRPNVVFVLTDDQGWADLGSHNNPHLETPVLDHLAGESVEMVNFYVSPVCAPTRASLMTGAYAYRAHVVNNAKSLSLMKPEMNTWAERLKAEGYATAIFGKWHLGDSYPHRPEDQGFDEVLIHLTGNLSVYPPFNPYLNPFLFHNGVEKRFEGFCMDIYTDHAIRFIRKNRGRPFFVYLPTNTPHRPLLPTEEYLKKYKALGLQNNTARIYAMIENIDDNVGRLLAALKEEGLEENTIFVFMNDNGPTDLDEDRYLGNLRGKKVQLYEGGTKAVCLIKFPGGIEGDRRVETVSAHIDLLPTVLQLCGIRYEAREFDGRSFASILTGQAESLPERYLFWQFHQTTLPSPGRAFAVRRGDYKLVQSAKLKGTFDAATDSSFELFNLAADPYERDNIIAHHADLKQEFLTAYRAWFQDVTREHAMLPYAIQLRPDQQNPLILTRRTWLGTEGITDTEVGHWNIHADPSATYHVEFSIRRPLTEDARIVIEVGESIGEATIPAGQLKGQVEKMVIPTGDHRIVGKVYLKEDLHGGVHYIKLTRIPDA